MNYKNYFKQQLSESLLSEMATTRARQEELRKMISDLRDKGDHKRADDLDARETEELRSDEVHGLGGDVVHSGSKGLGWILNTKDPSDKEINLVQNIMNHIRDHIVGAPDDPDYATSEDDISSTQTHPVYRRATRLPPTP